MERFTFKNSSVKPVKSRTSPLRVAIVEAAAATAAAVAGCYAQPLP